MELASSKLHLSASVSSEISFGGSRPKKKHIVLIVLFIGIISASGGFLLGYFLKGDKGRDSPKTKDKVRQTLSTAMKLSATLRRM